MAAIPQHTDLQAPVGFDRMPRVPVGTGLAVFGVVGALLGGVVADQGTRVVDRLDYRPIIEGTSLNTVRVEGPVVAFETPTRMARIRALAPLSFREWASVFGVSHSAIKQWVDGEDPGREKLDRVLGALTEASAYQPDLDSWLISRLPGMELRPVDLLREDRWRAFRGAIRARPAPDVKVGADELVRRRRAQVSWAVPEPTTVPDEA